MSTTVTVIDGACVGETILDNFDESHCVAYTSTTMEEIERARHDRAQGRYNDASDVITNWTLHKVITVFNHDGEAIFFIGPVD